MPVTRIVCPHCNNTAEVQVTSVTRSRECPHCGKLILMQTASRDRQQARKALLMPTAGPPEEGTPTPPARPQPKPTALPGDPRERMLHDPEVRRRVRLLKWGFLLFAGVLAFAVLADKWRLWSGVTDAASRVGRVLTGAPQPDPGNEAARAPAATEKPASSPEMRPPAEPDSAATPQPPPPAGPSLTDQQEALAAAVKFLAAPSVDERLKLVRDRQLNEGRIRAYYARRQDGPIAHARVEPLEVNPAGPFTYSFNVVLPEGTRRKIFMGKSRAGEYLADWASFVLFSEMEWKEFRATRPRLATMFRLLADTEELFGGPFPDARDLVCLKLLDPLDPAAPPLYGYAARNSSLGRTLQFVMEKNTTRPVPLMLKLSFPEGAPNDYQVWISDFIGEGWVGRSW